MGPNCGSSSVGRASAFQAEGRGFEPRLPLTPESLGDNFKTLRLFSIRVRDVLLFSTNIRYLYSHKPSKNTHMGINIYLVVYMNVIGYMCGGN